MYIYVGGRGQYNQGGYNGGGNGGTYDSGTGEYRGSGGGATHMATTEKGVLANYNSYRSDVLIVAGGGGGGTVNGGANRCNTAGGTGGEPELVESVR